LRLDDVKFELRPLQPGACPGGIARVVVRNSALRRLYPVLCTLQIGNYRLLTVCAWHFFAELGCLLSYGSEPLSADLISTTNVYH
jgi:hypothetical protein